MSCTRSDKCLLSSWERPDRIDGPGAFLHSKKVPKRTSVTPLSGRNDPYNPNVKRPGRISASPDRILSGLHGTKGGI